MTTMQLNKSRWHLSALGASMILGAALVACGGGTLPAATPTATTAAATAVATASATPTVAFTGGPTTSFTLSGLVGTAGTYKLADLQALPVSKVSTNAKAGNGELGLHEYSGPLLIDLLNKAQVKIDSSKKNDAQRKAIVITASDGYATTIAWGEIDQKLANKKIMIAYQRDGQPLPDADGFARLIVPGDIAAGRYISNVARIEVKDMGTVPTASDRKGSTAFEVSGLVNTTGSIDAAKLAAIKHSDITVETKDSDGKVTGKSVYGGVLLNDFLTAQGLKLDDKRKNDMIGLGILGIGSDGSSSMIVGGEIDPKFGNLQVLIATTKDGQPLAPSDGFARLVVPGDIATVRFISNLVKIEVLRLD